MKKDNDSVPRLDLAPQLKRPLSIWNLLDYLRLLYWVFFFPQALRWYVEKYGGGEGFAEQKTWGSKLEFLRQHPNQLRLLFQGLILIVCVPFLFYMLLQQMGFTINWFDVAVGVAFGVAYGVAGGVALGVAYGVAFGVALGVAGGVALGVAGGVALGVALGVARWRPENWLIGVPLNSISIQNRSFLLPRVTPIPLPLLKTRLKLWLRKDWQLGLENIDQLLKYSLQFIPVVNAINDVLAEIPSEQIIYRISQLAEDPYDWKLVKFASASLVEGLKLEFLKLFSIFPFISISISSAPTRLDTPPRATAAGFWNLHEKEPKKATVGFELVETFPRRKGYPVLAQKLLLLLLVLLGRDARNLRLLRGMECLSESVLMRCLCL